VHISKWLVFPDNICTHVNIDGTYVSNGELYAIITNKGTRSIKGSVIAIIEELFSD